MSDSTEYDGYPLHHGDIYYDCLEDIEISEAFFYNSSPKYMRTYVNKLGVSILYTRKEKVAWKSITVEDWKTYKKNTALRIDNIKDTDLLVAFCPIN